MEKLLFIGLFIILSTTFGISQQSPENRNSYFRSPLEIPLYLSGNFGELRSTHFHAGIDLKTQATEGHKVLASADGYISRIKIQTGGYGRALYIAHPNGLTTVYGHLQVYAPDIEKYVKEYQYRNKTHTVDIYLDANRFNVKKGELIALSGNSGSSGGPHVHFEIRETATQNPRNGLLYNFDIKDNIPPQIRGISIYAMDYKSFVNQQQKKQIINALGSNGNYKLTSNPIAVYGNIGFGIETYDYLNGSSNRCGIYSIELRIDSVSVYYHEMSSFSFSETSYINSHVDYAEWKNSGRKFQKTAKDPNNQLSLYHKTMNDMGYSFVDDTTHIVEFIVKDTYQNTSSLSFEINVKPNSVVFENNENPAANNQGHFRYNEHNYFEKKDIKVSIPDKALFNDIYFTYSKDTNLYTRYSDLHHVHNAFTPLHKGYQLKLKPTMLPRSLWNKCTLIRIENEDKEEGEIISSKYENGFVTGTPKKFGSFYIDVDTLAPRIIPLNVYSNANMLGNKFISFKVTDDLTGVETYDGYIDNKWALFEYDPKNDLIRYYIDEERLERGKIHKIELFATDSKNNTGKYSVEFFW